jgi:hypothetical protein
MPDKQRFCYNVSYSERRNFVWYRVAKNGTRSLHRLLKDEVDDYVYFERCDEMTTELSRLLSAGCETFAIVRNPWDRLLSAWREKFTGRSAERYEQLLRRDVTPELARTAATDFSTFVRVLPDSALFRSNVHYLTQTALLDGADIAVTGRFERYDEEVRAFLGRIGLGHAEREIPCSNRSSRGDHYSVHYTDETREIVGELYRDDLEQWGYTFESG